jgi:hypothetical protein
MIWRISIYTASYIKAESYRAYLYPVLALPPPQEMEGAAVRVDVTCDLPFLFAVVPDNYSRTTSESFTPEESR